MIMWVGAAIAGAAAVGSALLSKQGASSANAESAASSARSIAFQREMAQNAHQYEVNDLRRAGLNPILSGTGGPGARASGGAQYKAENEYKNVSSDLANSAKAYKDKQTAEKEKVQVGVAEKTMRLLEAQTEQSASNSAKNMQEIKNLQTQDKLNEAGLPGKQKKEAIDSRILEYIENFLDKTKASALEGYRDNIYEKLYKAGESLYKKSHKTPKVKMKYTLPKGSFGKGN